MNTVKDVMEINALIKVLKVLTGSGVTTTSSPAPLRQGKHIPILML